MPQLGSLAYTSLNVPEAADLARTLVDRFGAASFTKDDIAQALGHETTRSGAFNAKLADLRKYGLVDGRGDELTATPLARRLAHPANDRERTGALEDMVDNVALIRELRRRFPRSQPSREGLYEALVDLPNVDRVEAEQDLDQVHELLASAQRALRDAGGSDRASANGGPDEGLPVEGTAPRQEEGPSRIEFHAGPVHQVFPFTPEGVASLRVLFQAQSFWTFLEGLAREEQERP